MSHTIHHTDAFVLGAAPSGESNRLVFLFTEEFGYIQAIATSVRAEKSKLRYGLQPYMWTRVALVRGREVYRLTGAHAQMNVHAKLSHDPRKRAFLMRIISLLRRLLHGEGRHEALYSLLQETTASLLEKEFTPEELEAFECIVVMRMLASLGYDPRRNDVTMSPFIGDEPLISLIPHALPLRRSMIAHINTSLEASHL